MKYAEHDGIEMVDVTGQSTWSVPHGKVLLDVVIEELTLEKTVYKDIPNGYHGINTVQIQQPFIEKRIKLIIGTSKDDAIRNLVSEKSKYESQFYEYRHLSENLKDELQKQIIEWAEIITKKDKECADKIKGFTDRYKIDIKTDEALYGERQDGETDKAD